MATYSNNTTVKINGGVKKFTAVSGSLAFLYQVPSNVELFISDWNHASVGTTLEVRDSTGSTFSSRQLAKNANTRLGPGTQIWSSIPAFGSPDLWIYCVEYINTP